MDLGKSVEHLTGLTVYPRSVIHADDVDGTTYYLARSDEGNQRISKSADARVLGVQGDGTGFEGTRRDQSAALLCPLSPNNAAALRARLPWLRPVPLGLRTSVGFGDRLGLATPGHVQAAHEAGISPIFAQQSVRENARTGRTPQQVLDDAMWGLFQEGWRGPWGADADHLKTSADVDEFVTAGYTLYTIDPGDHVDNAAHTASPAELEAKAQALPWDTLEDTAQDAERRYLGRPLDLGDVGLTFDREALWRAAAKYGHAIAHTVRLYRYLIDRMGASAFELEVSVDETETPTSPAEHLFIASELRRLGVRWVSLAPRFVGRFEKGVDYIGDLEEFSAEFARHMAVVRALGPYKLSLHSGSDKFSLYPIVARLAEGGSAVSEATLSGALVHLKTAGTSYLEALRTVAQVDPALFRGILAFARERYDTDRATYHVSAQLANVPAPDALRDTELSDLLEQFDARQVLHVTFGSVLDRFGDRLLTTLQDHAGAYHEMLRAHFQLHLAAFAQ